MQFVLVQKPTYGLEQQQQQQQQQQTKSISFEQFCLDEQQKTYYTLQSSIDVSDGTATVKKSKYVDAIFVGRWSVGWSERHISGSFRSPHGLSTVHRTKSLNVSKQATYSHQAHIAHSSLAPFLASDPRWLDEFRKDINLILVQIEQRFNRLVAVHQPMLSTSEQIKLINELIGFIRNVQVTCSYIQSALIVDKQRELKIYADQLIRRSQNEHEKQSSPQTQQNLTRLLYDLLVTLVSYIQTYCHAYLIPYEVELYNNETPSIDLDRLKYPVSLASPFEMPRRILSSSWQPKPSFLVRWRNRRNCSEFSSIVYFLCRPSRTSKAFVLLLVSVTAIKPKLDRWHNRCRSFATVITTRMSLSSLKYASINGCYSTMLVSASYNVKRCWSWKSTLVFSMISIHHFPTRCTMEYRCVWSVGVLKRCSTMNIVWSPVNVTWVSSRRPRPIERVSIHWEMSSNGIVRSWASPFWIKRPSGPIFKRVMMCTSAISRKLVARNRSISVDCSSDQVYYSPIMRLWRPLTIANNHHQSIHPKKVWFRGEEPLFSPFSVVFRNEPLFPLSFRTWILGRRM